MSININPKATTLVENQIHINMIQCFSLATKQHQPAYKPRKRSSERGDNPGSSRHMPRTSSCSANRWACVRMTTLFQNSVKGRKGKEASHPVFWTQFTVATARIQMSSWEINWVEERWTNKSGFRKGNPQFDLHYNTVQKLAAKLPAKSW